MKAESKPLSKRRVTFLTDIIPIKNHIATLPKNLAQHSTPPKKNRVPKRAVLCWWENPQLQRTGRGRHLRRGRSWQEKSQFVGGTRVAKLGELHSLKLTAKVLKMVGNSKFGIIKLPGGGPYFQGRGLMKISSPKSELMSTWTFWLLSQLNDQLN